jgi:hypothetical protein
MTRLHWQLALVAVVSCGVNDDLGSTAQRADALTAEQCSHFAEDGQIAICHATESTKNPFVMLRIPRSACVNGHAHHAGDKIAVNGSCDPDACLPELAPCDSTLGCCDGLTCEEGACRGPTTGQCAVTATVEYSLQVEPAGPVTWPDARSPSGAQMAWPYTADDPQITSQGYLDGNGQHAYGISRAVLRYPPAACVPEGATIVAARLEVTPSALGGGIGGAGGLMPDYSLNVVAHMPANLSIPVPGDYGLSHWGSEKWADVPINPATFPIGQLKEIELSASGVLSISRTADNYFGLRTNFDVDDLVPPDREVVSPNASTGLAILLAGSCGSNFPLTCQAPPGVARLIVDFEE